MLGICLFVVGLESKTNKNTIALLRSKLLCDILKGEWGFDGVVVSDWGGCRDDEEAVLNGLDIEMGTWTNGLSGAASDSYRNYHMADPYLKGLREGKYTTKELDDTSVRVISQIINREAKDRLVILVTHTLDTSLLDSPILLNLE